MLRKILKKRIPGLRNFSDNKNKGVFSFGGGNEDQNQNRRKRRRNHGQPDDRTNDRDGQRRKPMMNMGNRSKDWKTSKNQTESQDKPEPKFKLLFTGEPQGQDVDEEE